MANPDMDAGTGRRSATLTALYLGVILLALALRLHRLDTQSLWYDEGVTATIAQQGIVDLTRWTAGDIQPPLYYYVVALWGRLAGWGEWSLRFPSALFGILTVPLLAAATTRLSRSHLAGLLATLFTAVHPLLVYYSQEARMYAMLVALGVLAGYWVARGGHWPVYVVVATAAVYTHYFAAFLLLALGIAIVADRLIVGRGALHFAPRMAPFLLANLAVLLLYTPWLHILFTQLDVDASYWQGSLKLWEALRHIAISFTGGETVLEGRATRLLPVYGAITLAALAALAWRADGASTAGGQRRHAGAASSAPTYPATRHSPLATGSRARRLALHAALWLLVPVAAVLALAVTAPKFNPRYVMMALPGLILLWSGGLGRLLEMGGGGMEGTAPPVRIPRRPPAASVLRVALGLLAATGLILGFLHADRNWFTDAAFTKDQWRELARTVRARREEDEAVVLVSGHAWPIWRYYAPDMAPVRLPEIRILDVNVVLDFANSAAPLRRGLAGRNGAWLVGWQDEVVDPMGVVPLQLGLAGREEPVNAGFWGLRLRHFVDLDVNAIRPEPPMAARVDANFGNRVRLLGYSLLEDDDLLLFWQPLPDLGSPIPTPRSSIPDLHITGQTFSADRLLYASLGDRRPAGYGYPTFRWQPGQVTVGRIPATEWAGEGALPGNYELHLGVYDPTGDTAGLDVIGQHGTRLGKRVTLSLPLARPTVAVADGSPSDWPELAPGLHADLALSTDRAEPGQPVTLEARWLAETALTRNYDLSVSWRTPQGDAAATVQALPLAPDFPSRRWPTGRLLRTVHSVRLPLGLEPGQHWLEIGLDDGDMPAVRLPFTVLPGTRSFSPPPLVVTVVAPFGEQIRLLGLLRSLPATLGLGQNLELDLAWQSQGQPLADYSVSVQWLDDSGHPVAQQDIALPGGSSNWLPGQVEVQSLRLLPPGRTGHYRLIAAVYDAARPGLPRLRLITGQDFVTLGRIEIVP